MKKQLKSYEKKIIDTLNEIGASYDVR